MKPTITWIVLANGARARFLEHRGPGSGIKEDKSLALSRESRRAGEIMSDRPGRAFASAGFGRSAMEPPTDPVEKEEADFMRIVAKVIEAADAARRFDRLIVAAAPQALGDLRKTLPQKVSKKIVAELSKDLTNEPIGSMSRHFEDVMIV